jgi:hypothetical protein
MIALINQASHGVRATVRIEVFNFVADESIGPFTYAGDVVVTCYSGAFQLDAPGHQQELTKFDQAVVTPGINIRLTCTTPGMAQMNWAF